MNKESHIAPAIKLSFVNPQSDSKSVLGKGVITLMRNINEGNSLNQAAKNMEMAYSKAWRILKHTSEALGCELVKSQRPKGSVLTEEGKMLLELYDKLRVFCVAVACVNHKRGVVVGGVGVASRNVCVAKTFQLFNCNRCNAGSFCAVPHSN